MPKRVKYHVEYSTPVSEQFELTYGAMRNYDEHTIPVHFMNEHTVYLALGSNLGDRLANLKQAIAALTPQMDVKAKSQVYETPPWGYEDQPRFLNQVIKESTYLEPEPLLKHL